MGERERKEGPRENFTRSLRDVVDEDFLPTIMEFMQRRYGDNHGWHTEDLLDALEWVRQNQGVYEQDQENPEVLPKNVRRHSNLIERFYDLWQRTSDSEDVASSPEPVAYDIGYEGWQEDVEEATYYVRGLSAPAPRSRYVTQESMDKEVADFVSFYGKGLLNRLGEIDEELETMKFTAKTGKEGFDRIYKEPIYMREKHGDEKEIMNVFAGLQWYRAWCFEYHHRLNEKQRTQLLLEIFDIPDLVTLASVVEFQLGIDGAVKTMLNSLAWSEWRLYPGIGEVAEAIPGVSDLGLSITVGEEGREVSARIHKPVLVSSQPRMQIYENGEAVIELEDMLPHFKATTVSAAGHRKIGVEGIAMDPDTGSPLDMVDELTYQVTHRKFLLNASGELTFEDTKKADRDTAFEMIGQNSEGRPYSYVSEQVEFDRKKTIKLLEKSEIYPKALGVFLLPYCDTPSEMGNHYLLPEEFVE